MPGVTIKKDDEVQVLSGKDRGRRGRVVRVMPRQGRIMVEGVARAKKHTRVGAKRTRSGRDVQQGGIVDVELFVDISNVAVVCRSCSQPTRVGYRITGDEKARVCKKCEAEL
jgi:large subunit ribosomal protein L24